MAADPAGVGRGDLVTLRCLRLDARGAGVGTLPGPSGQVRVHIEGALSGERVSARVVHLSPHERGGGVEAWADLVDVLDPSPDRVSPACPVAAACGGCSLMHLAYPAQLLQKRARVKAELAPYAELAGILVGPCVPSPVTEGYRNNAKLMCGRDGQGRLVLGAYAPRSHTIVDGAGCCCVIEPALSQVVDTLRPLLADQAVVPFDETRRTGLLRAVVMRSNDRGEVLVALVTGRPDSPAVPAFAARLAAACPAVTSVVENVNLSTGNEVFGTSERTLWGPGFIEDSLGPVRLAPRSFFQANRAVAATAYAELASAVRPYAPFRRAVDAYAGAGGIAFTLAPLAAEVIAIEENEAATQAARALLETAAPGDPRRRVRFVTGDVASHLGAVGPADLVVLNPPRKGCARAVLDAVARLTPRLVAYLSCDPATLARDLAVLARAGLRPCRVTPFDMLPHTPHVETLAILRAAALCG